MWRPSFGPGLGIGRGTNVPAPGRAGSAPGGQTIFHWKWWSASRQANIPMRYTIE